MEFGSFDDDLFDHDHDDNSKSKSSHQSEIYVPKLENPCWFLPDSSSDSTSSSPAKDDFLDKERMRANYFYWQRDYAKAADVYDRLLKATSSSLLQLEFTESRIRSLMGCERFDQAEPSAVEFYKRAINYDQQLQALNVLSDLYWQQGSYQRCAVVSGCLASMTDGGNADMWYRLGQCFRHWDKSVDDGDHSEDLTDLTRLFDFDVDFSQSAASLFQKCLLRAHAAYWATFATSVGYARHRNDKMRRQIESDLRAVCGGGAAAIAPGGLTALGNDRKTEASGDEKGDEDGDHQQPTGSRDLDRMIEDDLVCVFGSFVRKWLK